MAVKDAAFKDAALGSASYALARPAIWRRT